MAIQYTLYMIQYTANLRELGPIGITNKLTWLSASIVFCIITDASVWNSIPKNCALKEAVFTAKKQSEHWIQDSRETNEITGFKNLC